MRFEILGLVLLLPLLNACREEPQSPPAGETAQPRELDALSTEQLRVFLRGFPGDWRADTNMARGRPEPPAALPVPPDATIIDLPEPAAGDMPLGKAIANRRSQREFADVPLTLAQLSFLLASTQGVTHTQRDDSGETVMEFRATPSGGGRYPLETFLVVRRIGGLAPGLYRYLPPQHQLLLVREDPSIADTLHQACYDNTTVGAAAVTFIWAAVPARTEWKYGCIAHKMIAIEAGHVCQNLYLAAEAIGAGTCALLGYHQPALDELLGIDGNNAFTIYLAPVGIPAES